MRAEISAGAPDAESVPLAGNDNTGIAFGCTETGAAEAGCGAVEKSAGAFSDTAPVFPSGMLPIFRSANGTADIPPVCTETGDALSDTASRDAPATPTNIRGANCNAHIPPVCVESGAVESDCGRPVSSGAVRSAATSVITAGGKICGACGSTNGSSMESAGSVPSTACLREGTGAICGPGIASCADCGEPPSRSEKRITAEFCAGSATRADIPSGAFIGVGSGEVAMFIGMGVRGVAWNRPASPLPRAAQEVVSFFGVCSRRSLSIRRTMRRGVGSSPTLSRTFDISSSTGVRRSGFIRPRILTTMSSSIS